MIHSLIRAFTRRYPLLRPRAIILRWLPDVPQPNIGKPIRTRDRLMVSAYHPGPDHVCKSLYWFGDFDPWVGQTLTALARDGDIALDIGANVGATALPLAKAVGQSGRLYAFEPMPETAAILRKNLGDNGYLHTRVEHLALSDHEARINLKMPHGQPGMARLASSDEDQGFVIDVSARRFDAWARGSGINKIAVCKIDVEGHEDAVLIGMGDWLSTGRIGAFLLERHIASSPEQDPALRRLLDAGYTIWRIHKGLRRPHYVPLGQSGRGKPTPDFLACHPDADAAKRLGLTITTSNKTPKK